MIKHIVLFNLKDHAEGASKNDNLQTILRNAERLRTEVPVNKQIEVSQQLERERGAPRTADLIVVVEFESIADFDAFRVHPVHQECAAFAVSVSKHVEAFTYESTLQPLGC